jgi:DNA mismatch repair protein MLH1
MTDDSEELFYQIILNEFCNMGHLQLSTPISIRECVSIALEIEAKNGNLPEDIKSPQEIIEVHQL